VPRGEKHRGVAYRSGRVTGGLDNRHMGGRKGREDAGGKNNGESRRNGTTRLLAFRANVREGDPRSKRSVI